MKGDLGYLQISGSELKQRFVGLPDSVDNRTAGTDGKRTNSKSDDKRGIVKLGFTPRENDEYTFTYIKQDGEKENPPYAGTSDQKPKYWQWPEYDKESYYYQGTTKLGDIFTLKSRAYRDTFKNTLLMYNSLSDLKNKKAATATMTITPMAQASSYRPICASVTSFRSPLIGKKTFTASRDIAMHLTIVQRSHMVAL